MLSAAQGSSLGGRSRVDTSFILSGPLAPRCGLCSSADIPLDRWASLADALHSQLGSPPSALDKRVHRYYLPVYFWLRRMLDARASGEPPMCVGLQCVQGGGKTTLVSALELLFRVDGGRQCVAMSLDDFYLPREGLDRVSREHEGNRLLQVRGNPLTHDVALCAGTLRRLRALRTGDPLVSVPSFDKTAHSGRGDRRPEAEWPQVRGSVDVVVLEGWCLGFRARPLRTPAGAPSAPLHVPELAPINEALRDFESVYELLDALVVIGVAEPGIVYRWREEAESANRAAGRGAMTAEQVVAFVDCYMPAYREYLPALLAPQPGDEVCAGRPQLRFAIDHDRQPMAIVDQLMS